MPDQQGIHSKLDLDEARQLVPLSEITALAAGILRVVGCAVDTAEAVAGHLVDASLSGVESHGVMRLMQYVEQFESGYMDPAGRPEVRRNDRGAWIVDGNGGIGIPAMTLAMDHGCAIAKKQGISVTGIVNLGHTGRLGAYGEWGANQGCLNVCTGGGGRRAWRQVAPHGGRKAILPTNPYCFGIPGGARGPVVLDFATSKIAGGWIYAAKSAGALLPEGAVIDAEGRPTRDPDDYLQGGAILPSGGPKGYAMGVMAELIGEALLGPATTELSWLLICIDTTLYRDDGPFQATAEEILQELRDCPPAPGFERVEVPGERERDQKARNLATGGLLLPEQTWRQIKGLAARLKAQV